MNQIESLRGTDRGPPGQKDGEVRETNSVDRRTRIGEVSGGRGRRGEWEGGKVKMKKERTNERGGRFMPSPESCFRIELPARQNCTLEGCQPPISFLLSLSVLFLSFDKPRFFLFFFSFFFSFVDFSKTLTLPLPTGCVNRVHRDPPTPLLTARSIETLASFKLFSSLIVSDRSASPTSSKFLSSRKAGKRKLFDEF